MTAPSPLSVVIEKAEAMSPTVRGFTLRVLDVPAFRFQPGQWVSVVLPGNGVPLIRAYSIASAPREDATFELAVTHVPDGAASEKLFELRAGDRLRVTGPFGTFHLKEPVDRPVVFIATGTGVAPFRSMIHDLLAVRRTPVAVTLVLGVRTPDDILYGDEFRALERKHANFNFIPSLSQPPDNWTGARGYVQATCEPLLNPWRSGDIYICGVSRMVNDMRARLGEWGYGKGEVHYERYD